MLASLTLHAMWTIAQAWLMTNPWVIALALYVAINVAKRIPPPTNPTLLFFWQLFERVMFLGWDRWGGSLKWLGTVAPGPIVPEKTDAAATPKAGPIATLMLAVAMACGVGSVGCIPAKTVTTIVSVLSDALFAIDQMDAAFGAFCAYSPEMCAKVRGQYEQKRGAAIHGVRFGQNAVEAYNELFAMLEGLGVVSKPGIVKAATGGFTPWVIQSPFEGGAK